MNGARRLALRRAREARAPAVLQGGFRPFFLVGTLWFLGAMALWLAMLAGVVQLPSHFPPVAWHRHELIFGGVGAAMAGYLLTATPNWSGRLPAIGMPLLAMVLWWALARLINAVGSGLWETPWPAALIDTSFFLALAAVCGRESWNGKGRGGTNAIVVGLFAASCLADHYAAAGALPDLVGVQRMGIALLVLLISIIGGKLVPSFTRNVLPRATGRTITAQQTRFDDAVHLITAAACLLWVADAGVLARVMLGLASAVHLVRAVRWQPYRVWHEPSVLALHISYLWLPIGLLALTTADTGDESNVIHLLTAGAISCMILAVMARMSIAQTGRQAPWRPAALVAVLLTSAGAAVRVLAGTNIVPVGEAWRLAGGLWMLGFALFLFCFAPMLLRRRAKQR
ncbi:NnrS family protein [Croceicoccus sp. F390]|uniref:NnrS family protein n=1 Tax=Croceicoccus esteveae TaxID=3075597 RepID=A0ABU2ZHG3_9SPHN|nr:NnrS family protein [Croceicoccus sp. F390]MDT0576042.1 NnrS family protein [Croceicoccus sp. F390]